MSRPIGNLEKLGTIEHFLGYYGCVCITARYTLNNNTGNWKELFEDAVCKTIVRHPNLFAGIINEDTNDPTFVRLDEIDLSTQIEYKQVSGFDYDRSLEKILQNQHSQRFRDLDSRPGWKLIIVLNGVPKSTKLVFDAIFAFHHAVGDGKSGLVFHNSVLEALDSSKELIKLEGRTFKTPKLVTFPLPIEKQLDFKTSWSFIFQEVWNWFDLTPSWMKAPSPWLSTPCLLKHVQNYRSRTKTISIDSNYLLRIIPACRKQGTTVTGLLHGIIVASLSSHVPEATSFSGGVPFSMRHLLNPPTRGEMGNYVSGLVIQYPSTTISALRSTKTNEELTNEIWKVARTCKQKTNAKLAHIPNDLSIGLIPWTRDLMGMFRVSIDQPRSMTFETSNVGVFTGSKVGGKWWIERMLFSQSGQVIEAAVCFNAASVAGGALMISVTWLEGAIEERLVDSVCGNLELGLKSIGKGDEVRFM